MKIGKTVTKPYLERYQDNALALSALSITKIPKRYNDPVLNHPSYSLDLAHVIFSVQFCIKRNKFQVVGTVKEKTAHVISKLTEEVCFEQWKICM